MGSGAARRIGGGHRWQQVAALGCDYRGLACAWAGQGRARQRPGTGVAAHLSDDVAPKACLARSGSCMQPQEQEPSQRCSTRQERWARRRCCSRRVFLAHDYAARLCVCRSFSPLRRVPSPDSPAPSKSHKPCGTARSSRARQRTHSSSSCTSCRDRITTRRADRCDFQRPRATHLLACAHLLLPLRDLSRQPMAVPSLLDLQLRRDLSSAWNQGVVRVHELARWFIA